MFLQLFVINRSGGLVYNKNLSHLAPNLTTNDCLRLGSTFHGLHAIATQIAPVTSTGIEKLETDTFILQCKEEFFVWESFRSSDVIYFRNWSCTGFQTLTGIKFVVTATPGTIELDLLLQAVYELYADFVLKVSFEVDGLYVFFCHIQEARDWPVLLYTFNLLHTF